jgi:hypothetical protein
VTAAGRLLQREHALTVVVLAEAVRGPPPLTTRTRRPHLAAVAPRELKALLRSQSRRRIPLRDSALGLPRMRASPAVSGWRSLRTIWESTGPVVLDYRDRCGKRASRDALRALLPVVQRRSEPKVSRRHRLRWLTQKHWMVASAESGESVLGVGRALVGNEPRVHWRCVMTRGSTSARLARARVGAFLARASRSGPTTLGIADAACRGR